MEVALDQLGAACAEMRSQTVTYGGKPEVIPSLTKAEAAYQDARALIAHLRIRPHAGSDLVEKAQAAADAFLDAHTLVARAVIAYHLASQQLGPNPQVAEGFAALGEVGATVERGYEATKAYEQSARIAVGKLLGSPESRV